MPFRNNHTEEDISRIVSALKEKPGALMPILRRVQDELGYIPSEAVPIIAKELNLTRADVHGVITFYHDFRSTRPGQHVLKICQAESCQAMGSVALTAYAKQHLGVDFHQTTADQVFTLDPVYCLGNCALSPAVMVDGDVHGRTTPQRLRQILEEVRQQR
jgi:formate dehydrogenase subunit gamma